MSAHTPGPWLNYDGDIYDQWPDGSPGIPLMRLERASYRSWGRSLSPEEAAANARLIAAAPEMVQALRQAERILCGWEHVEDSPEEQAALRSVRAAIAKAEGEG